MNKIIQINLAGQAVSIDEHAYDILSSYLGTLERHFKNTESGNEILTDIEARIAELFFSKLKNGSAFINDADVDEAIGLMGTAEDMGIDDETESNNSQTSSSSRTKKLFRNPEDRVISGTCSGLAAYFGVDASVVRISFLLLVLLAGVPILPYLILWIAIPEAKTPHDRYRMQGDANTVSDIANKVRTEAQTVSENLRDGANKFSDDLKKNSNFSSTAKGVATGIERVIRFFAKIFGAGTLAVLVAIGIAIAAVLLSNATGGVNIYSNGNHFNTPTLFISPTLNWIFSISLLCLILIPIGTVCYAILQFIFNMTSQINFKGVFIAWLLCLAVFIGTTIYSSGNINTFEIQEFGEKIQNGEYNWNQNRV
jgi:phage shock protein PspC (stress-responsive transcriptional regulator)